LKPLGSYFTSVPTPSSKNISCFMIERFDIIQQCIARTMPAILVSYSSCQLLVKPVCLLRSKGFFILIKNVSSTVHTIKDVYVIGIGMKLLHGFA